MKPTIFPKDGKLILLPKLEMYISGFISGIALVLAFVTVGDLKPNDRLNHAKGFILFALGMLFFISFYMFCIRSMHQSHFGQRCAKRFKLNKTDILDISNKIVSSVQALFCCLTGITVCTHSCTSDPLKSNHYVSEGYAWFGAAYFLYDIWSMYHVHISQPPIHAGTPSAPLTNLVPAPREAQKEGKTIGGLRSFSRYVRLNAVIVAHHLFIGIFGFLVITYFRGKLGDCVFGFVYLMEASTPFVSIRSVLSRFQLKSSKLYIFNGFAMLLIFFLCRVAMFPYVMWMYAKAANITYWQAIYSIPRGCKISISILLIPQIYWFYLMLRGATKVLRDKWTKSGTGTLTATRSVKPSEILTKTDTNGIPPMGKNTVENLKIEQHGKQQHDLDKGDAITGNLLRKCN